MNSRASVIIPTYERPDALQRTLNALERQSAGLDAFDVVVADDGSSEPVRSRISSIVESSPLTITLLHLSSAGPAHARNRAIEHADGDLLLLLGDDTAPIESWVECHVSAHRAIHDTRGAFIGPIRWDEACHPTPFMRWLERSEHMFHIHPSIPYVPVDPLTFCSSNASIPTSLFEEIGGFDESFKEAALEDTNLGARLAAAGSTVRYEPDATVLHNHALSFADACRRQAAVGRALSSLSERMRNEEPSVPPLRELAHQLLRLLLLNSWTGPTLYSLARSTADHGATWAAPLWRLFLSEANRRWRPPALRRRLDRTDLLGSP